MRTNERIQPSDNSQYPQNSFIQRNLSRRMASHEGQQQQLQQKHSPSQSQSQTQAQQQQEQQRGQQPLTPSQRQTHVSGYVSLTSREK